MPLTIRPLALSAVLWLAVPSVAWAQRAGPEGEPGPMPPGGWVHEQGVLGTAYPQPGDVRFDDALVNQDTSGGAEQVLEAVVAAGEGFAAVWRDTRHGNLGLFLGRLDRDGEPIGTEQPVHAPRTSRQVEPAIGAGGALHGAIAWFAMDGGVQQVNLRHFERDGGVLGPVLPLGTATGRNTDGGVARVDPGRMTGAGVAPGSGLQNRRASRAPALGFGGRGTGWVVWREGERLFGQALAARPGQMGAAVALDPDGPGVESDPIVATAPAEDAALGGYLVGWTRADGIALAKLGAAGTTAPTSSAGAGSLVALTADDRDVWLLVRGDERLHLRRLARGTLDGAVDVELPEAAASACIAAWNGGLLVVIERPTAADGQGALALHHLDREGRPLRSAVELPGQDGSGASGPRVAAHGDRAIVAWTDRREGDPDVFYRVLTPEGFDGPDRRWNSDRASADQTAPAIASDGGRRAVILWEDRSEGRPQIRGRRLQPAGFDGDQFALGDAGQPLFAVLAMLAMGKDGGFAAAYAEELGQGQSLFVRAYGPDNRPLGPALHLGERRRHQPWKPAVAALPGGGFGVLARVDRAAGEGSRLVLAAVGAPGSLAVLEESEGDLRHPALVALDDRRLLACWDEVRGRTPSRLGARFLDRDLTPQGETLRFHPTPTRTGDWDPAPAPAAGGGFALAWTGNESPTRDVFARFYDADGRPISYPVAVSALVNEQDYAELLRLSDGSHVVVWEDDISFRDHIHARRVGADGRAGPAVTVNQRPSLFVPDRTMPHAAALGDGFAVVWSDRRRGLGHDVYVRVLGPAFDADLPEPRVLDVSEVEEPQDGGRGPSGG
ncbi:MAG: hypothetical protein GC161_15060 [Planctomycetaceae bacterium]|nr:hypothetical protein [Planctomycetaceae bacterium]